MSGSNRSQTGLVRHWSRFALEPREAAVLVLYSIMVGFAVLHYQQSLDECREWLVARTFLLPHIVFHVLHYEGHPALLYVLLWLPAHLHMPYPWINALSAAVGITSTYVLLRLAPFPFYLRALLPFCFALGYQEAVVARSYVLFPLLAFLAAHQYRDKIRRPLLMALTLALLANLSFHGTLVAMGFGVAYVLHLRKERKAASSSGFETVPSQALWPAITVFVASLLLVAVCIYPEKYNRMTPEKAVSRILHRAQGPLGAAPTTRGTPAPSANRAQTPQAPATAVPAENYLQRHRDLLQLVFVYPVSSFAPLAIAFEVLLLCFLCLRGHWMLVLPIICLDYFLLFGFVAYRHTPLVWITYLMLLWAAWDANPGTGRFQLQRSVAWAMAFLCILQVPWTLAAIHYELHHATYPAKAAAAYLETLPPGTRIDGDRAAYTVMPYIPGFVPTDRSHGRFADHASFATSATIDSFLANNADVLLLNETLSSPEAGVKLQVAGYTDVHTFCGGPYFPNIPVDVTCFHAFARR